MTKITTSIAIADTLWGIVDMGLRSPAELVAFGKAKGFDPEKETLINVIRILHPNAKDWVVQKGLSIYKFEQPYFKHTPFRGLKYAYGSHVELYHMFYCSKHRYVCSTSDSYYDAVDELYPCCPQCNNDNMFLSNKDKYVSLSKGRTLNREEFSLFMKRVRFEKKYARRENLKYFLKKWTERGYLLYRLKLIVNKIKKGF